MFPFIPTYYIVVKFENIEKTILMQMRKLKKDSTLIRWK
jgi:hypothetical protein